MVNPESKKHVSQLNQITTGANIFVGDIIKLREGEIAPCDLLILTTSEELNGIQVCRVDSLLDDGKVIRQVKEGVSLTKSFANLAKDDTRVKEFLRRLYARVKYKQENNVTKGTFKLKADPRVEIIDESKIISKGTVLKSRFAIGLVLFNGKKCLGDSTRSNLLLYKSSSVQKKITMFSLVMAVLNLISCVLLTLANGRLREYTDTVQNTRIDTAGFLGFVSLFFSVMPLSVNIFLNCFYLISAAILQNKYREFSSRDEFKKLTKSNTSKNGTSEFLRIQTTFMGQKHNSDDKSKKDTFRVLNPEVIGELGDIDDAFFDKTGTLTLHKYEVKTIATRTSSYDSKDSPFCLDENMVSKVDLEEKTPENMISPFKMFKTHGETYHASRGVNNNKFIHLNGNRSNMKSGRIDFKSGGLENMHFAGDDGPADTEQIPFKLDSESDGSPEFKVSNIKIAHSNSYLLQGAEKMQNETNFITDLSNSEELSNLISLFTVCHNSKLSGSR